MGSWKMPGHSVGFFASQNGGESHYRLMYTQSMNNLVIWGVLCYFIRSLQFCITS